MRFQRPYSSPAPRSLRQVRTELDNIALVPASQLDSLEHWTAATRQLPPGSVLVVAQSDNLRLRQVEHQIDQVLRRRGRRARLMTVSK